MIALALALAVQSVPPDYKLIGNADDETDATCFVAIGWAAKTAKGKQNADNLAMLGAFYLGRITGRGSRPDWQKTVDLEADKAVTLKDADAVVFRCNERMAALGASSQDSR